MRRGRGGFRLRGGRCGYALAYGRHYGTRQTRRTRWATGHRVAQGVGIAAAAVFDHHVVYTVSVDADGVVVGGVV